MGKRIEIVKSPWYTAEEDTPSVGPAEFAIKIAEAPAESDGRKTVALLAAYRLPGRFGLMYGARIRGVVRVVAINPKSGAVYFNHAEPAHAVPVEAAIDPDAKPTPGEPILAAIEGAFNFDLADQLGLPPEEAEYLVFAWLDEITSESLSPTMPEDKQRPKTRAMPGRADPPVITFGRSPDSPPLADEPIALRGSSKAAGQPLVHDLVIHGAVSPKILPPAPPAKDEPPTFLTVMAIGSRNRVTRWHSIDLPNEVIERKECCFEFNLGKLADQTDPPQKVFVIAVLGTQKSGVLVVETGR